MWNIPSVTPYSLNRNCQNQSSTQKNYMSAKFERGQKTAEKIRKKDFEHANYWDIKLMASGLSIHFSLFDYREYSVFEYGITFLNRIKDLEKNKFNETPNMPVYGSIFLDPIRYFRNH